MWNINFIRNYALVNCPKLIKMNTKDLTILITLVLILYLSSTHSQYAAQPEGKKGPGISGCTYYGFLEGFCGIPQVPIDILPSSCTSFFWDGLTVDLTYNVYCSYSVEEQDILDQLLQNGKPVYVYYGHYTQEEWSQIIGCSECNGAINAKDEMAGLQVYMDAHPGIAGLILTSLQLNMYSLAYPGFSQDLASYLKVMRETFSNLDIGIELYGSVLIDYYLYPDLEWLDFTVIDPLLDFYVVNLYNFNNCSAEFKIGGTTPITGNTQYTLDNINCFLRQANIPSDKIYYNFRLTAQSPNPKLTSCNTTYQQLCRNPNNAKDWCADTQESFYQKGQFVKKNAAGFIGTNIDFNDPYLECNCVRPFSGFYDILDGFNGDPQSACCPLMNRA